jgi:hypothetical protein
MSKQICDFWKNLMKSMAITIAFATLCFFCFIQSMHAQTTEPFGESGYTIEN